VARTCDFLVTLPMKGRLASVNVSAAAAVLCYEVVRQRRPGRVEVAAGRQAKKDLDG
jgi:23S rRNA (guanosine2251-2'-O)-methyltransferase